MILGSIYIFFAVFFIIMTFNSKDLSKERKISYIISGVLFFCGASLIIIDVFFIK